MKIPQLFRERRWTKAEIEAQKEADARAILTAQKTATVINTYPKECRSFVEQLDNIPRCKVHHHLQESIQEIWANRSDWIRPVEEWSPRSFNPDRQLISLLRHLFVRYPITPIWGEAWVAGYTEEFIRIGRGESIRAVFPELTAKEAHYLNRSKTMPFRKAIRLAQLEVAGIEPRLISFVLASGCRGLANYETQSLAHWPFWLSVVRFFQSHSMLDYSQLDPVIDYLNAVRLRGILGKPANPDFSMKGRSPEKLLKAMEKWHQSLKAGGKKYVKYPEPGIANFELEKGDTIHRIEFVGDTHALHKEGQELGHCVFSYDRSCRNGQASIWSYSREQEHRRKRVLTIEVRSGSIVQVRGRRNRLSTESERHWINEWATANRLTSAYV